MKRDRIFRFCLCLTLCFTLAFSVIPLFTHAAEEDFVDEAANELREAMVQRLPEVTYTYESPDWIFSPEAIGENGTMTLPQGEVTALLQKIYSRAIAHNGVPNQGDYLRWHIAQCAEHFEVGYTQEGNRLKDFKYIFTFTLSYYTTAQQENELTATVQTVLSQLDLANKTDYEKIKAIYDYICTHVAYDNLHLSDPNYNLQYTAYAALIRGTSVCQGYSSLFYRMALQAGLDNRMIIGESYGEHHAWNIVKLDGVYYNVDSTWDAESGDYRFFLKTDAHMADHEKDAEHKQLPYPMATQDYPIPGAAPPATQPQTQPTTVPVTPPVTTPVTQPAPTQATQPVTVPKTEPTTAPTTAAATEPTTVPVTNPTTASAADSTAAATNTATTHTQKPTQEPTDSEIQPEEKTTGTWILALGGAALLAAAAGGAVLIAKKRK